MRKAFRAITDYLKKADMLLLALCCISTVYGIILIHSATGSNESGNYVAVQIASLVIGILLFIVFSIIDIEIIADKWMVLFGFNVIILCLLIPFGVGDSLGNKSWLRFGGIGIQPAEVVKVTFTIIMARHIYHLREYKNLNSPFSVFQLTVHFVFMFGLIMLISRDLGSALVYLFIFIVVMYAGGIKLRWFALGGVLMGGVIPLAWKFIFSENQKGRILAPYVASIDPTAISTRWQSYRSKVAIASGQLTGQGLGAGKMTQSGSIPEQHTDFIFSVAGEELGLIGCLVIVALLALIIIRCIYVGSKARNQLSSLFCMGIAAMLIVQTLINIGMCLELTPVIGVTLPFFSYGGSSIITLFAAMGIVSGIKMRTASPWKRHIG